MVTVGTIEQLALRPVQLLAGNTLGGFCNLRPPR